MASSSALILVFAQYGISAHFGASSETRNKGAAAKPLILRPPDGQAVRLSRNTDIVVEGGDDLVGVLFRVVTSQAADREIDDFMTVPRSRRG
jgi:hypothetical protein